MKPFITKNRVEPNGIDKLLKRIPRENFLIEVNNLLANRSLDEITPGQIIALAEQYKIKNPLDMFGNELVQLFRDFLNEHLNNQLSSTNDFQSAKKIQGVLGISDLVFEKEYRQQALEIFKKQVSDTLNRTKKYNENEPQFEPLGKKLGLTTNKQEQILNEVRQSIVQQSINKMLDDARISPQEKEAFDQLCKDLDVTPNFDSESKKALENYSNLWQIENGELPVYETDIFLQKNETCHYQGSVKLYELRTKTVNYQYRGSVAKLRITKSWYYRVGNIKPTRETQDIMTLIDSGTLYVTNKRILFNGSKGNKVIKYSQIVDLTPYTDGVQIIKDTGKPPLFQLSYSDGETLCATIGRLITDQQ
ncbi:MAG TPA: hypothetical protein DD636_05540 [Anaerolineaceae bacterium]|jgi:hypothetical protein|nr:hypothetical protein [Anaerolineaceae bacterium]